MSENENTDSLRCPACRCSLTPNNTSISQCGNCGAKCTTLLAFDSDPDIDFVFCGRNWRTPAEVQEGIERVSAPGDPENNPSVLAMRQFFQEYRDRRDASDTLRDSQINGTDRQRQAEGERVEIRQGAVLRKRLEAERSRSI